MLTTLLGWLDRNGYGPELVGRILAGDADAKLIIQGPMGPVDFLVKVRQRAPWPGEMDQLEALRGEFSLHGVPLLVAPYISQSSGKALAERGWSWADETGNAHLVGRSKGLEIFRLIANGKSTSSPRGKSRFPSGGGGLGVVRSLLNNLNTEENTTGALAVAAGGITSQRASQVLHSLEKLEVVIRAGNGVWKPDREKLLDLFLDSYRGPGGFRSFYYTAENLHEAVSLIAKNANSESLRISADVASDLLVGSFKPRVALIYLSDPYRFPRTYFIPTVHQDDANVIAIEPADNSVVRVRSGIHLPDGEMEIVDPAQLIYDLQTLGGDEREDAAGRIRTWLLNH
jgi:hypothetical protein